MINNNLKKWVLKKPAPKKFISSFSGYHPIILQLLYNRGITKKREIERFLNPLWERDLYNPFLIKGMREAAKRIKKAIKNSEKVGLFADYDADGIPGAALLWDLLKFFKLETEIYIPTREEGYGLNEKGVRELGKKGCSLMITIDCGIKNLKEIKLAQKLGIETIIIDHHLCPKILPPAIILNPKQKGDSYPFKELAAGGISFKLAQALLSGEKEKIFLKWLLDLSAISTITDVVPLISENRIIAKYGLIVLEKTKRVGLQKLYQVAGIDRENITPWVVSFQIGPRINAPGRINHASASFFLLITKDKSKGENLAKKLNKINSQRQKILEEVLAQAREKIKKNGLKNDKVIMISEKNWPQGIVGLVAGKLMEEFARPAIVLEKGEGESRGSARSIDGFDIVQALDSCQKYLIKYGGHPKAAGLTLKTKDLENLYNFLLEFAESRLNKNDLVPKITIDGRVNPADLNFSLYKEIEKFSPHGLGNPQPLFLIENAKISNLRTVGNNGQHLKFKFKFPISNFQFRIFDCIGFDLGNWIGQIKEGEKVDLVVTLDQDTYNGLSSLQLKILDLRKSNPSWPAPDKKGVSTPLSLF